MKRGAGPGLGSRECAGDSAAPPAPPAPPRILRSYENKTTAEVHDYLDERTGVLAAMLAKRAPGYAGLGFSDPRRLALTPSASTDS
jgi:hypothetical protein